MKTPVLISVVAILHVVAIGSVFFMQGCGTTPQARVEPPPAPVLPPRTLPDDRVQIRPQPPVFQPSMPVEPAPTVMDKNANVYVVEKGDMLSKIAVRYGVSAREIAELNNLKNANDIRVGQKLLLPSYAKSAKDISKPKAPKSASVAGTVSGDTYVIAAGDSLSKIAARYGMKMKDLQAANAISNPNSIRIGQKLVIPGKAAPAPAPVPAAVDFPAIEEEVFSPIEDIPAPLSASPAVTIAMPAPVAVSEPVNVAPAPSTGDSYTHTVAAGETLDLIAITYAVLKKDLAAANGLSANAALASGQKLVIPFGSNAVAP